MKPFRLKKFSLVQSQQVFRVGTDAVLLGVLCDTSSKKQALEVGSGTGIISLMLAQRNQDLKITALDINADAVQLSRLNFDNSIFSSRLSVQHADFPNWESPQKYDLIVSNPPYFLDNQTDAKDYIARHQAALTYQQLINKTAELLQLTGVFSCIIPFSDKDWLVGIAEKQLLFLQREVLIKGNPKSEFKRVVLEFSFEKKALVCETLVIEKKPRVFSEDYLFLTKDFHVFGAK